MDLGEPDLEEIEKTCADKGKGYVPQEQVILLKQAILKARSSNHSGINSGSHKDTKKKFEEQARKTGWKKTNKGLQKWERYLSSQENT